MKEAHVAGNVARRGRGKLIGVKRVLRGDPPPAGGLDPRLVGVGLHLQLCGVCQPCAHAVCTVKACFTCHALTSREGV